MKEYKKPSCVNVDSVKTNIIPAAVAAAAKLSVGGAFAAGVAAGLMKDKIIMDNIRVKQLKAVKA